MRVVKAYKSEKVISKKELVIRLERNIGICVCYNNNLDSVSILTRLTINPDYAFVNIENLYDIHSKSSCIQDCITKNSTDNLYYFENMEDFTKFLQEIYLNAPSQN